MYKRKSPKLTHADTMGSLQAAWRSQILTTSADYKRAVQTGDFSGLTKKADNPKLTIDELKSLANDFPEVKVVMEDAGNHCQGVCDEYQSVTDDLESGGADKPTAIERVKAQGEKMKAECIANFDASTERVLALIEGLPDDNQQKAADFWDAISIKFAVFVSEVLTQVETIFETVIEWLSQVWEQVKQCWSLVKEIWTKFWAWLQDLQA
ncbi:hypothetical protein BGZ63DRAFT_395158 [Mariannaea sp. PMI_226]|nr:hypothetical protein BGZ63DRAFT_395158 [Mariannaea sp. PMI_226]